MLDFDHTHQYDVVSNQIDALSEHGKLSLVRIADTPEHADDLYRRTVEVMDREGAWGEAGVCFQPKADTTRRFS